MIEWPDRGAASSTPELDEPRPAAEGQVGRRLGAAARTNSLALAVLAFGLVACNEHNPIPPYARITRSAGTWQVASSDAGSLPSPELSRLRITIERTEFPTHAGVRAGQTCAWGSVEWSNGPCPATFQVGTPNNPGTPNGWASYPCVYAHELVAALPNAGFAFTVEVEGPTFDVANTDPDDDWLYIDFKDAHLNVGDNWAERLVRYERVE